MEIRASAGHHDLECPSLILLDADRDRPALAEFCALRSLGTASCRDLLKITQELKDLMLVHLFLSQKLLEGALCRVSAEFMFRCVRNCLWVVLLSMNHM